MRNFEDLFGTLPELVDLTFDSHLLNGVSDTLNVYHSLISEWVKQVERLDGFLTSLLIPENEIDPFVEVI